MRRCGSCTLCCTLTQVSELGKPSGKPCVFISKGCAIYSTRPQSCRKFQCAWLAGEMPHWMKPDAAHVMVERLSDHFVLAVPQPGHEKTWRTEAVSRVLIDTYQKRDTAVVSMPDGRALIPEGHTVEEVNAAIRYFAQARDKSMVR